MRQMAPAVITGMLGRIAVKRVARFAARQRHADMLQAAVGERQLRPDGANLRLLRKLQHRFQPFGLDRFGVVVEEQQVVACG